MKQLTIILPLIFVLMFSACNGDSTSDQTQGTVDLDSEQQAELVAAAISSDQGGVEDDISSVARAVAGDLQKESQTRNASYGLTISVNVDFYDKEDVLQENYDPNTTDRIDYRSEIQGQITDGVGFFSELDIDNQSDFKVEDILSNYIWINGTHTNHSSYRRTQHLTQADVDYQLQSELTLTEVALDLNAQDRFPESGTIEGRLRGSYKRETATWEKTHTFDFHFIATYLGDNTAEVELGDGTVLIVQLDTGDVEYQN